MPSYVIIWENNTRGHMRVKGHEWVGHAAMNISEKFDDGMRRNYVSWWPDDAFTKKKGLHLFEKVEGSKGLGISSDIGRERYLPDHVIRLASDDGREQRMKAEWEGVHGKKGGSSFSLGRKNCSAIVSRVLHAGGYYGKKWALNINFVWTPADVRRLAVSAGGEFISWTAFLKVLDQNYIKPEEFRGGFPPAQITLARSGAYCTTGAPCKFQQDQQQNRFVDDVDEGKRFGIVLE